VEETEGQEWQQRRQGWQCSAAMVETAEELRASAAVWREAEG
jgi:hypothetical protein